MLRKVYRLLKSLYEGIWKIFIRMLVKKDPLKATKVIYKKRLNRKLNLDNPKDFNEKVLWLKHYWESPLMIKCADKYLVRDYIEEKNCSEILNPLYGVYDNADEIDWDSLPNKFVLKTNNASGTNLVCLDKALLDKNKIEKLLNKWLDTDFGYIMAETHYSKMPPKILCEKFIETEEEIPTDFKFFCFDGQPRFLSVVKGRTSENLKSGLEKNYYDMNLNFMDIQTTETSVEEKKRLEKPETFDQMVEYAKILSKGFPFVRVDFYEGIEVPIFGEMTFTPTAGMAKNYTDEALLEIGEMIHLPNKN